MDLRLLDRWLHDIRQMVIQLRKDVDDLRQFQTSVKYDKQVQANIEIMVRMQSSQASYTNLIIVAGYAAFFTFWSTLKNDLPKWLYAVSGLLIVLSLLIFIAWEVIKMIWSTIYSRKVGDQLTSPQSGPEIIPKLQQDMNAFELRMNRLWVWFLIPTVVLGLLGGLSLVAFFIWKLCDELI